jgi:hypothetical protein
MAQIQETFLFTPTSVPGCSLWLDAADRSTLTVSGSNVTQWNDKSGTTNVSQANASLQPTYEARGFNGRPTLRVTGVQGSSFQELTTGTTNQYDSLSSLYMFCVYRVITSAPQYPSLFSIQNKVTYYLRGLDNANNFGGQNVWTYNGASFVTNNDTIVTYDQNGFLCLGLDGGFQSTYVNGSFTGAPKAFSFGSGTSLILRIGYSGYNANDGFNGYISEVLVYKASLSTLQRQQVEGYLAWKWGLQANLPSNHPFKTYRPLANTPIPTSVPPMPLVNQGTAVFLPTQISGCQLWMDSTDLSTLTLSGSNVSQWRDKSTNAYTLNQATTAYQPIRTTSTSGLQFEGLTYMSQTSANLPKIRDATSMTILAVARNTTTVAYNNILTFWYKDAAVTYATTPKFVFYTGFGGTNQVTFQCSTVAGSSSVSSSAALTNNTTTLIGGSASSTQITANYNGTISSAAGLTLRIASSDAIMTLGYPSYESNILYELILYDVELTTAQRQQVEGYLAWKWGLTANLPNGHPYKRPPIAPFPVILTPVRGSLNQWQPLQVSGCRVWLDGADPTTLSFSGTSVTQWRDKSGTGNNYTNNGTLTYSNRGVSFPGTAFMQNTSLTGFPFGTSPSLTTFIVFAYTNVSSTRGLFQYGNVSCSKTGYVIYADNDGVLGNLVLGTLYCGDLNVNGRVTANTITMVSDVVTSTGVSGSLTRAGFTNGSAMDTRPTDSTTGVNLTSSGSSRLGDAAGQYLLGTIYEVLFYSTTLSTSQRQQVEGYLAWKWGLVGSLPATHPFKRWPPPPS